MTNAMATKKDQKNRRLACRFRSSWSTNCSPNGAQVANKDAESIFGEAGLAGQIKKALAEHMLQADRRSWRPARLPGSHWGGRRRRFRPASGS